MDRLHCDVLISGGGVAGLTAAAAFGSAGFSVICVDPQPPVTTADAPGTDLRTTAFLQPARALLDQAGLWDRLAPFAAPLQVMRIVDAGGETPEPRIIKDFDADDISDAPFGWNLPNWLLRREMMDRLSELDCVTFLPGIATTSVLTRTSEALISLSNGTRVAVQLLIAADGRTSFVRDAVGLGVKTKRYGQKALAFSVTHPIPHGNVSTEIHRSGGPFTLVPLPDRDGMPCSSVVWMDTGPNAVRLKNLPVDAFETEMNERSCGLFGPLKLVTDRSIWPMISQIADRFESERTALIAEAAHAVPPIGAQGLNMSLGDTQVLLDLAMNAPTTIGNAAMLHAYHRKRHPEVKLRVTGIDALNRASMMGSQQMRDLRAGLLNSLYSVTPVRKTLMKAGLGTR
ncbi:MAG: UbiH/UbiF family hydroxylase [Pseudoruegeria sp.]